MDLPKNLEHCAFLRENDNIRRVKSHNNVLLESATVENAIKLWSQLPLGEQGKNDTLGNQVALRLGVEVDAQQRFVRLVGQVFFELRRELTQKQHVAHAAPKRDATRYAHYQMTIQMLTSSV